MSEEIMMNINKNNSQARPALGKGLASLLPNANGAAAARAKALISDMPTAIPIAPASAVPPRAPTQDEVISRERIPGITMADVEAIVPNQYQPRRDFETQPLEELAASIKANGIIQPLIVRKGEDGKLHLIAGERRLRASKMAGLKQVPVVVRKSTDKEALELALIENLQREDLNCIDIALSYFQLIEDFHLTQDEVATRVGRDRASVANHLRLLKLQEEIINDLRQGKLSFGHGRALLAIADPMARVQVKNKIIEQSLSVRDAERLIASIISGTEEPVRKQKSEKEEQVKGFEERLARALGAKVAMKGSSHRGSIVIQYFSREDLDRLTEQLLR
jgi:ParB family transcriptional regulator, chromosome partitioning protein